MDDLTEVKLMMEGGLADRLLVRRLSLKEGICRIPTAELVLCTKGRAIRMDELETYVEKAAALEISRRDAATARRTTRWFSGMVTSVEGCGVVAQSRDGDIFEYRMTIQPRLVNLCYSRSGRNFIQTTALEAAKTILEGFDVQYRNEGLPESANLKRDFFQRRESDYAFLMRILASCGLSYTFRTPDQADKVTAPMMYVGAGNALPAASDFLCDGKSVLPSAFSCAAAETTGDYCRMDSWRMRKSIGVDSLEVGFTNRAGADVRGAAGTGDARRMRMDEELFVDSKQDEIDRLAEEHLKKLRVPTAGWTGMTQCLEALPGNLLKVNHFYGRDTTDVIEALVFSSTLECTLPILPGESVFGEDDKVSMRIAFSCLAGMSAPATVSCATETVETVSGGGGGGEAVPQVSVRQALVTDLSGNVSDETTNAAVKFVAGKGYVFKAMDVMEGMCGLAEDGKPRIYEVKFTQPVGGYGQGLFRMPRVGDRVLVLCVPTGTTTPGGLQDATYYLLGYLPGEEMPFTTSGELNRPEKDAETYRTALPEEMMALRFRTPGAVDENTDLVNKMGIRGTKLPNGCSELAFYGTHDFAADKAYGTSMDRKVLANFQSTGNMQLSANHNLEMNARNLTFKGKGWAGQWVAGEKKWELPEAKVAFGDINKFVVEAQDSITFKVGNNSISITQSGISINASRFTDISGPVDANIKLDPWNGVKITGTRCAISGFMGATIGDAIGAAASFSGGSTSLTGAKVSQRTTSVVGFVKNAAFGLSDLAMQLTGIFWNDEDNHARIKKWQPIMGLVRSGANFAESGIDFWKGLFVDGRHAGKNSSGEDAYIGKDKRGDFCLDAVELALKLADFVMQSVIYGFEKDHPMWMSEPHTVRSDKTSYVRTNGDHLKLAAFCVKATLWTIAVTVKSRKAVMAGASLSAPWNVLDGASVDLKFRDFTAKCAGVNLLAEALKSYKAVCTAADWNDIITPKPPPLAVRR